MEMLHIGDHPDRDAGAVGPGDFRRVSNGAKGKEGEGIALDKMQASPSAKKDSAGAIPLMISDQKIMEVTMNSTAPKKQPNSKRKPTLVLAP
jgi:hypothetical protein